MAEKVQAITSFRLAEKKGRGRMISEGTVLADDDPTVKKVPHLFGPIRETIEYTKRGVEQTTSAPGERRLVSAPDDLEQYHKGGGWYEIEGETVRGVQAARKLLES